jgi:DnaJ-class molecular chaperone
MMGRMDLELRTCPECKGSGKDPRNRKRLCPRCGGNGKAEYCTSCCEFMPCRGTEPVFDQTHCAKPRNMYEKATKEMQDRSDRELVEDECG